MPRPYRALKKGVMISVNPDAHSIHEMDNIRWSICAARKGGIDPRDDLECHVIEKGASLAQTKKPPRLVGGFSLKIEMDKKSLVQPPVF